MIKPLTLWTIKNKKELSLLKKNQTLTGNKTISHEFWEGWFTPPYEWMNEQMKQRIPGYKGESPLWAWTKRPDFRSYKKNIEKGDSLFLIEFKKNKKDVLISDYDLWHLVLNGYPYLTPDEESFFDKKYQDRFFPNYWENKINSDTKMPKEIKNKIEKSWQIIFKEITVGQATFESLNLSEVISIKEYKK